MSSHRVDLDELRRALAGIVGELRVSTRAVDRTTYSRDMWPRTLLAVQSGHTCEYPPDVIVWPETVEEVADLVKLARRLLVPIVPYGAGSGVCGGAVPIHGGIVVDMKKMASVLSVDTDELTCEVQAGIVGERLERELAACGLTLGHFPSSIYCSTLGGWLAGRSAGQMSTKYGKIEDMVRGITAVTGRGDIITTGRSGRSASGPDWTQLLVGSEGTLAILCSARLRLRPAPELRLLKGFEFANLDAALESLRSVLQRGLRPAVVRLYDPFESLVHFRLGHSATTPKSTRPDEKTGALPSLDAGSAPGDEQGWWDTLRALLPRLRPSNGSGEGFLRREAIASLLNRPRMLNSLAERIPSLGRRGCLIIIGTEGARARTKAEAELVFSELLRSGGRDLGEELGERWFSERYAVSYRMSKVFESGAFADTMEVASTWERLLDLHENVRKAIGAHAFVTAHFSHAYSEGCSIYFTFVGHAANRKAAEEKYDKIWAEGLAAASRAGGTISHHHGIGLMKARFMADEHRESMSIYQSLKRTFDPDGVLNPGKMGLSTEEMNWTTITRS